MIKFRKLNSITPQAFSRDVKTLLDDHNLVDLSPSECLKLYRNTLTTVLNTHAPEKTRKAATRSRIPWFNDSIAMTIRHRCMADHNWANHHSDPMAFTTFYRARCIVSNLMDAAENRFYKDSLAQHQGNTKEICKISDSLLGRNQDLPLPPRLHRWGAGKLLQWLFMEKISKVWDELNINRDQLASVNSVLIIVTQDPPIMDSFSVLSDHDVAKIIHRCPSKSCEDDPIPTTLPQEHTSQVSFQCLQLLWMGPCRLECFQKTLKQALVKPLLKRANLDLVDKNVLSSFQSRSCQKNHWKSCHRSIDPSHSQVQRLMEPMQSAYRMGHSMEMTLLKAKTNILRALDSLVLLDLSAAFDKVDHQILINRLTSMFGISGCALTLIRSYLRGRSQRVKVGELRSAPVILHFGFPRAQF